MATWIRQYFNKDGDHGECKLCGSVLSGKSTTFGLRRHLKNVHHVEFEDSAKTSAENKCEKNSLSQLLATNSTNDNNNSGPSRVTVPLKNIREERTSKCSCNGNCSTRLCGCMKKNLRCVDTCKCSKDICQNPKQHTGRMLRSATKIKESLDRANREDLLLPPDNHTKSRGRSHESPLSRSTTTRRTRRKSS